MTLITDNSALAEFCRRQARADHVAVDTEFMRDTTYWPRLCLVQMRGPRGAAGAVSSGPAIWTGQSRGQ